MKKASAVFTQIRNDEAFKENLNWLCQNLGLTQSDIIKLAVREYQDKVKRTLVTRIKGIK